MSFVWEVGVATSLGAGAVPCDCDGAWPQPQQLLLKTPQLVSDELVVEVDALMWVWLLVGAGEVEGGRGLRWQSRLHFPWVGSHVGSHVDCCP